MLASHSFLRRVAAAALPLCAITLSSPGGAAWLEGARCAVVLSRISYDDPGSDDAEFIVLRVETRAPATVPADAGTDARPPGDAATGLTLGDCGLAALELVDGQSGACAVYRTIPLADVTVPDDGAVVVCAAGVPFAAACDVTSAGRTALKAGWLQNGPSDGVRLRGTGGDAIEIGYEPPPACFGPSALRLVDESGEMPPAGSTTDDVNTWCDGRFVLLGSAPTALRAPPGCPRPAPEDPSGGPPDGAAEGGATPVPLPVPPGASNGDASVDPEDAGYVPERAPAPRPSPSADDPLFRTDAGPNGFPDLRPLPKPPGCAIAVKGATKARGAPLGALLVVVLAIRRALRRRRRSSRSSPPALRAGCGARCGWWPSR